MPVDANYAQRYAVIMNASLLTNTPKLYNYSTSMLNRPIYEHFSTEFSSGCVKTWSHVIINVIIGLVHVHYMHTKCCT